MAKAKMVYRLQVRITSGPITAAFVAANPAVNRTIEIRGDQTLEQLHRAIFDAFDRDEMHLYEFQLGKKSRRHRDGPRYGVRVIEGYVVGDGDDAGDVAKTQMDDLCLKVRQSFGYWFDFGDDWMHELKVKAIGEAQPGVVYPRVTECIGDSPPQYIDWDVEDDEEDEVEEEDAEAEEPGPRPDAAGAPPRLPLAP
jgi:hypothetical protein